MQKVVLRKRIATGDDHCAIVVHLKKTVEAEEEEGVEYPLPSLSADRFGGPEGIAEGNAEQFRARIRLLERKVLELETTLEERKLIEKARKAC